jgi:hypothetical protein
MKLEEYNEISKDVDDAILLASNKRGNSIKSINLNFQLNEFNWMVFIFTTPLPIGFLLLYFNQIYLQLSNTLVVVASIIYIIMITFTTFTTFSIIKKKTDKAMNSVFENKVVISENILNTIYEKIELFSNIDRKYNLNVKELDELRNFLYKIVSSEEQKERVYFLNPQPNL